jgi:transposase InsO family protein
VYSFASVPHAQDLIEAWRHDYNERRPHGAVGHLTPMKYAEQGQRPNAEVADLQLDPVW